MGTRVGRGTGGVWGCSGRVWGCLGAGGLGDTGRVLGMPRGDGHRGGDRDRRDLGVTGGILGLPGMDFGGA